MGQTEAKRKSYLAFTFLFSFFRKGRLINDVTRHWTKSVKLHFFLCSPQVSQQTILVGRRHWSSVGTHTSGDHCVTTRVLSVHHHRRRASLNTSEGGPPFVSDEKLARVISHVPDVWHGSLFLSSFSRSTVTFVPLFFLFHFPKWSNSMCTLALTNCHQIEWLKSFTCFHRDQLGLVSTDRTIQSENGLSPHKLT